MVPGSEFGVLPPVELTTKEKPRWAASVAATSSEVIYSLPADPECADPAFEVREYKAGQYFQLAYGDGTQFFIDGAGARVWGSFVAPLTIEDLATYFLGPVMGFVLRRRGAMALHASAVNMANVAVAFSGAAGAGKSTTAAALALRGAPVLCEDIAVLDEVAGEFLVRPGYPRVCLWPDAVEKLCGAKDALPNLTPTWEKKFLSLDGGRAEFAKRALSLGAVYLFGNRACEERAPFLGEISVKEALLELVQNTYMNKLLNKEQRAAEFELLSRLVTRVPCKRVTPHSDPKRIGALCELIKADAAEICAGPRFVDKEPVQ
ncbi:MAG: hypothetical protein NVS9B14_13350 [Candidatus Acidiferrum sp.]